MCTHHKICPDLEPTYNCIVVEEFTGGVFVRRFHKRVADYRLSNARRVNLLHALILHFWRPDADTIVQCYMNRKWKSPPALSLPMEISCPEPGVERITCGTDIVAWVDQVVDPEKFRCSGQPTQTDRSQYGGVRDQEAKDTNLILPRRMEVHRS